MEIRAARHPGQMLTCRTTAAKKMRERDRQREREREEERGGAPWYQVMSLIRHGKVENQTSSGKSAKSNEVDRCYLVWSV